MSGAVSADNPYQGEGYAGGLLGYGSEAGQTFRDSFVLASQMTAPNRTPGAVCPSGSPTIENVWVLDSLAGGIQNDATGTVTAGEAGQQETYTAAGWSFDGGEAAWRMKAGRPALSWEPDQMGGRPVLQGRPKVVNLSFPQQDVAPNAGNTLYADVSELTTDQGKGALGQLSFQWARWDTPQNGATGNTYLLPQSGSTGATYRVLVTASGCEGVAVSDRTMTVENRLMLLGTVQINNAAPKLGDTLQVDVSGLSVTKGSVDDLSLTYEWGYYDGNYPRVLSTSQAYVVGTDAVDHALYVRVSASGAENYVEALLTQPVGLPDFSGGTGTEDDPYQISSVEEWQLFRFRVGVQNHIAYRSAWYELTQDLDFSQQPVNATQLIDNFSGVLDGNGYAIRNLSARSMANYGELGLFKKVSAGGVIKNLHLENVNITGGNDVGSLVGLLEDSTLSNCTVSGTLKSENSSGVLGGLVARAENAHISDCRNYITLNGTNDTGGIVGQASSSTLERVYNYADISKTGGFGAGGIVGVVTQGGTISQAVNMGAVRASSYRAGGIVGQAENSGELIVDGCINRGSVSVSSSYSAQAGGIVGSGDWANLTIRNTINSGAVYSAASGSVGGLVGEYSNSKEGWLTIQNCANTGSLSIGSLEEEGYAGGAVGVVRQFPALTVENFYAVGFPQTEETGINSGRYKIFGRLFGKLEYQYSMTACSFTNCYTNADPSYADKNSQSEFYTYVADMRQADFVTQLNANLDGQGALLPWRLAGEVNGGYPSFDGQESHILYADAAGVELYWSGSDFQSGTDFVAAVYDSQGRLTAAGVIRSADSLPSRLTFPERAELESGGTVKVFRLNGTTLTPLDTVLTYQIP